MQEYSVDEKNTGVNDFAGTRGNSQLYNCSGDFSKSASVIDESNMILERDPAMSQANTEAN